MLSVSTRYTSEWNGLKWKKFFRNSRSNEPNYSSICTIHIQMIQSVNLSIFYCIIIVQALCCAQSLKQQLKYEYYAFTRINTFHLILFPIAKIHKYFLSLFHVYGYDYVNWYKYNSYIHQDHTCNSVDTHFSHTCISSK